MAYIESAPYGEAWSLAVKVQSLGITGPASTDWARVFKLGGASGNAVVGYDPAELARVAGGRFGEIQKAGGQLSYGGVAVPVAQAPQVAAMWSGLIQGLPPMPHPDASDQSLGPNLGGHDGVQDAPGQTGPTGAASGGASGGSGGLLLLGGAALLLVLLLKK